MNEILYVKSLTENLFNQVGENDSLSALHSFTNVKSG